MRDTPRRFGLALTLIVLCTLAPSAQQRASQADVNRDLRDAERLLKEQKLDEAVRAFQAVIDGAHALGLDAEETQANCGLGETLNNHAEYARAKTVLHQCLDAAERLHSELEIGRALLVLSINADLTGQTADAVSFADRAVAAYDAAQSPHGRALARLQLLRVRKFSQEEKQAITERIIEDARLAGDRIIEGAALRGWGDSLFNAGRFEEALDQLTRARDLYHEIGQFDHEGTVYNSIGRVYRAHGRLDEALKCQLQALALHEKYGAPFELMQSHNAVAVVETQIGNLAAARTHYERALAIARQSGSPRIQDFLNANIAVLLNDDGEYEKAAHTLEEVIAHGTDVYPSIRYSNLSIAYLRLNRLTDAIAAADRALATCGDDQLRCIYALENRAAAYGAANNDTAALTDLHKALEILAFGPGEVK